MGVVKGIIEKPYCDAAYETLVLYLVNLLELGHFFRHSQVNKLGYFFLVAKTREVEKESAKIIIETKINDKERVETNIIDKERAENGTMLKLTDIEVEAEFLLLKSQLLVIQFQEFHLSFI